MISVLERIVEWAQREGPVRVLILGGSHAAGVADQYSDYDVATFCSSDARYTQNEAWLSEIGQVWVCVHEKIQREDQIFPTRLVIFEGGVKADFSFFPMQVLHDLVAARRLPEEYQRGYTVLVDKDGLTKTLLKASGKEIGERPSREEFLRVVEEFWFEVYHVAIALAREDLWVVKRRSRGVLDFLLTMIEWNEQAKRQWKTRLPPLGKRMRSWVDETTWKALHQIFAHFDRADSRKALEHTMALFRRLAIDTAADLGYSYPHDLDQKIVTYVETLAARA